MLEKAVAAVKADKAKALAMFIKGEGGFKDRDLYPFCFSIADGKLDAAPPITIGKDVRTLKDKTGDPYGQRVYDAAKEGVITEVSYAFPRPGSDTPVPKVRFVTKIGYAYPHVFASRKSTHWRAVQAERREHRDNPLLRAGQDAGPTAAHGQRPSRLRLNGPPYPRLHTARARVGVFA